MNADRWDILDSMATGETLPSRREAARTVRAAILVAARKHVGKVHISDVRPLLPDLVRRTYPNVIGAVFVNLSNSGILHASGEYRPSGNKEAGNKNRPTPVYWCNTGALALMIERETITTEAGRQ